MKFVITKEILVETLQKILGPSTTKQNFPVLNSVFLETSKNRLKLTTTDLDVSFIASIEAQIKEDGKIAVPMKRLLAICRELPACEITIETNKNNLLIRCEKIEFKINTIASEEFPKVEEGKKASLIKINPHNLEEMLRMTAFCVGYEEVNYVLNGVLFEIFEESITAVATDGKRLSMSKKNLAKTQTPIKERINFILPIKAVNEVYKIIKEKEEEMFLVVEENRVGFDFKETQFFCRPIEGDFPEYSQYIPKEGKDKLTIDRLDFLLALKRADVLSTPDYQGVKLELKKEGVTLSKNAPQLGEAREDVAAQYSGENLQIGFNPAYLIDLLKNLTEEKVCLEFLGSGKPAVLRKEDYIYLALPMAL